VCGCLFELEYLDFVAPCNRSSDISTHGNIYVFVPFCVLRLLQKIEDGLCPSGQKYSVCAWPFFCIQLYAALRFKTTRSLFSRLLGLPVIKYVVVAFSY